MLNSNKLEICLGLKNIMSIFICAGQKLNANNCLPINFKMPTFRINAVAVLSREIASFLCILIFMKIKNFMLKLVEHEQNS